MGLYNHLDIAKALWKELLPNIRCVLDATLGNGHDALFIAHHLLSHPNGRFFGIDLQKEAIEATQKRLFSSLQEEELQRVTLLQGCHSQIKTLFHPLSFDLIYYNLGYLPGSDHRVKSLATTTIESLKGAIDLLTDRGSITITAYPGHSEGEVEKRAIEEFLMGERERFHIHLLQRLGHSKGPTLFHLQKREGHHRDG